MIIFENQGEIDPRFISSFGVNVKEGEQPIGFFGTGLKYALAILMRHQQEVIITSGTQVFFVTKKTENLRGKDFDFVYLNDQRLGFTTELGKTWELWMAYRELFCNMQDEGGTMSRGEMMPPPNELGVQGYTRIIVVGAEFEAIYADHGLYFLMSNALLAGPGCEVHVGETDVVFYRGMLAGHLKKPGKFTYNITGRTDLTEDRTIKYLFNVDNAIVATVLQSGDKEFIRTVVGAGEGFHEHSLNFKDIYVKPQEAFLDVVGQMARSTVSKVNTTALERYKAERRGAFAPTILELTDVQTKMLERAIKFCGSIGFKIEHQIICVVGLGTDVLGLAKDEKIYLAEAAFNQGTKRLAGTIIEEHIHLVHAQEDMTRSMQNFLLDKLVSLGEELTGEPL